VAPVLDLVLKRVAPIPVPELATFLGVTASLILATAATTVMAVTAGAHIVRVHRVGLNRDAARLAQAVFGPRPDAR